MDKPPFVRGLALFLGLACCAGAANRYLYVVGCAATVDKVDTVSGTRLSTTSLTKASDGVVPTLPQNGTTFDGCLANGVAYAARASILYTVVPANLHSKPEGTQDYRLLGFSIPAFALVRNSAVSSSESVPHVRLEAGEPMFSEPNEPELPAKNRIVLERSAHFALVRLLEPPVNHLNLAVEDRASHALVRLQNVPGTTALKAHLAPGGSAVLIEQNNGSLSLYNAATGTQNKTFPALNAPQMIFLAISPNGKAIYHSGSVYALVDLAMTFPNEPVAHVTNPDAYPPFFFANR